LLGLQIIKSKKGYCGDKICQYSNCNFIICPKPETPQNCSVDCPVKNVKDATDTKINPQPTNGGEFDAVEMAQQLDAREQELGRLLADEQLDELTRARYKKELQEVRAQKDDLVSVLRGGDEQKEARASG